MKLTSISITNFKSIKDLNFDLQSNYHVLAGKNESGKTNILEAFSYLDSKKAIDPLMIREPLPDEEPVKESKIRFIFKPDKNETDEILKGYQGLFYNYNEIKNLQLVTWFNNKYSVIDFFKTRLECLISVNFIDKKRLYQYWSIFASYKILENWKIVSENCPVDSIFIDKVGNQVKVDATMIINTNNFSKYPKEHVKDFTCDYLNSHIGSQLTDMLKEDEFSCIHWYYDPKNLLPSKVSLNDFKENQNICIPLKYLFNLAGIKDIKAEIELASTKNNKSLKNLLGRVSVHSTAFFKEKWKEYDNVEFELTINGNNIEIGVKEQNSFEFSQRSDGFKRFITFLIMISAKVRTDQLKDTVLLIDEPEIGLHPSGQRFLREELRTISENNTVIFSTHSIFLIDTENLDNHFIIEKEKEITKCIKVESSNIVDEEVIFNALGYSVFESLKQKNILFEGWRDKNLFKIATSRFPSEFSKLKLSKNYGLTHAKGVKEIKYITPILELANRDCIIVSDSDKPAKEKQKEFQRELKSYTWLCYDELLDDEIAVTAEDFIKSDIIIKSLKEKEKAYKLPSLTIEMLEHPKGKIYAITEWLKPVSKEKIKEDLDQFKNDLFNNLKSTHIETKYFKLLEKIVEILN